jgi:hypothetical protein
MAGIVATFKTLSLDEMIEVYPQITTLVAAAKDARRFQLEAEIKALASSRARASAHRGVLQGATLICSTLHRTAHRWSRPATRRRLQSLPE